MTMLKAALGRMVDLPQFIVWRLTWDNSKKKYAKIPIHPSNPTYPTDASKPENWLSFDDAQEWVLGQPHGQYALGFYFTDNCGYWFLDVDNALLDGVMTPVAADIYSRLSACAFEYSSSAKGYHFFGRGELPIARQIKPAGTGLELYTQGRGVAFGLSGQAYGNADVDATEVMVGIVAQYFAPDSKQVVTSDNDFEEPRADYYCESTDEELLQRMLRSSSMQSKFDISKPTFADYYTNNVVILEPYWKGDISSYDSGLALHLAYWTGCNAPRMKKFMLQSELVRDKWNRSDYLDRTIKNACLKCSNVRQDKPSHIEKPLLTWSDEIEEDNCFLGINEQKKLFKDCVYILDRDKFYIPLSNGAFRLLSDKQFNSAFGKYIFKLSLDNGQGSTTKKASEAFLKSQIINFLKVDYERFDPTKLPISVFEEDGVRYLNTYDPIKINILEGDASLFTNLVHKNFPNGNDAEILLSWMAACVQYPGQKFMWAPVLQGGQGIGKTTITECLKYAVGRRFVVTPKASELGGKFNAWVERALVVVINEMKQDRETEGEVKKLVTDTDVIVEAKGVDGRMTGNYANFIFTLNEKSDFKKSKGDRRFCVMYSALQELEDLSSAGLNEEWFGKMNDWLRNEQGFAIVANYLKTYPIAAKWNPAKGCVRAPDSSSEEEVYENSRSKIEVTLREAVDGMELGFRGGWISSKRANDLLANKNIDSRLLKKYASNMGYKLHPSLKDGRLGRMIIEEGNTRIYVYCTEEVIKNTCNLTPSEIAEVYLKAQYSGDQNERNKTISLVNK
jgi:hypothetical protein